MKPITLSREYGAGGHSIGTQVAEKLGIPFYDKDIIKNTAIKSGMDPELIIKEEERLRTRDSIIEAISPMAYDQKTVIYTIEREVILELVNEGPCVILGRCADFILEEEGIESLDVFIYADEIHRAMRVSEMINSKNPNEIQKAMKKADQARHAHYAKYTGKNWGSCRNYNLCLDSGMLGYDKCIDLICAAAKD